MVSSLYGPLGISTPFSLQAKMLLQELCSKNLGWDEIIPHPLSEQWSNWLTVFTNCLHTKSFFVTQILKPLTQSAKLHIKSPKP